MFLFFSQPGFAGKIWKFLDFAVEKEFSLNKLFVKAVFSLGKRAFSQPGQEVSDVSGCYRSKLVLVREIPGEKLFDKSGFPNLARLA